MSHAPCPRCGALHDMAPRTSGDRVYCHHCCGWFMVRFVPADVLITPCDPPVTWPKERKEAGKAAS